MIGEQCARACDRPCSRRVRINLREQSTRRAFSVFDIFAAHGARRRVGGSSRAPPHGGAPVRRPRHDPHPLRLLVLTVAARARGRRRSPPPPRPRPVLRHHLGFAPRRPAHPAGPGDGDGHRRPCRPARLLRPARGRPRAARTPTFGSYERPLRARSSPRTAPGTPCRSAGRRTCRSSSAPARPDGNATFPPANRRMVNVTGYWTFRQVASAGRSRATPRSALGVRARLPFRVFTARRDAAVGRRARLVIDVAHAW